MGGCVGYLYYPTHINQKSHAVMFRGSLLCYVIIILKLGRYGWGKGFKCRACVYKWGRGYRVVRVCFVDK